MPQARIAGLARTNADRTDGVRLTAPSRSELSGFPASWYLLCPSRDLQRGPVSKRVLGRDLVAFKTASGRIVVMSARCSHLGADLGKGKVVGESIQCPFHGWRYGPDGRCRHIPGTHDIPVRAGQTVYPAVQRYGTVFFFNGPQALFPLPLSFTERSAQIVSARPVEFVADCAWFMVGAHGFDAQHFEGVHSRRLHAPLVVDCPSPFARRSRYTADVLGCTNYDRLLKRFVGSTVEVSITNWGGTMVVITARFQRATSRFAICMRPVDENRTLCQAIPFAYRAATLTSRILVQPVNLWLRRLFTGAYLLTESRSLGNPRYNAANFVAADAEMIAYFKWIAALPRPRYTTDG